MNISLDLCQQRIPGFSSAVRFMVLLSLVLVSLAATREVTRAADHSHRQQFRGQARSTSRTVSVPPGRCNDQPGQPPVIGVAEIQGAGDIDILGQIFVQQSHCVRADGSFFSGVFRFTNRSNSFIEGRYFGASVPTFNSKFPPNALPFGPFLVEGNACVSGGNVGQIDDDCQVGRYFPARGFLALSIDGTGDASIFIDQTIGIANNGDDRDD
jgi:hypothetical protein